MVDDFVHEDMIFELKQEIERLRDLLWENDIDPEPFKEAYGPATADMATIVNTTLKARMPKLMESLTKNNPLLSRLSQGSWDKVYRDV